MPPGHRRRSRHRVVRQGRDRLPVESAVAAVRGLPGGVSQLDELAGSMDDQDPLLCVVEIPRGGRNKYEYDPELGAIKLDRFISASVVYPTDYGYVPRRWRPTVTRSMCSCVSPSRRSPAASFRQGDRAVQDGRREGARRPRRVRAAGTIQGGTASTRSTICPSSFARRSGTSSTSTRTSTTIATPRSRAGATAVGARCDRRRAPGISRGKG